MATIWIDGEWHTRETGKVSVFDHGLLYGDGVFEGIRVYAGKVFKLQEHLDRIYECAHAILLTIPMPKAEFGRVIEEAVTRAGDYIRSQFDARGSITVNFDSLNFGSFGPLAQGGQVSSHQQRFARSNEAAREPEAAKARI